MGWSPRCYIPSYLKIGLPVPEKIFEGFFTIYGRGGHLGHVTCDPDATNKLSVPLPKEAHIKFGFDRPSGFRGEDV